MAKKRKNRKGFTLVELLVAMAILGIIIGIALPIIRNVQGNQTKQKYDTYHDSVEQSARIYVDNYGKDEFGNEESGCIIIPLAKLIELDLAKDIQIDQKSCETENSFVRVDKKGNRYTYATYLSCVDIDASGNVSIDDSMTDKIKLSDQKNECKINKLESITMRLSVDPTEYSDIDRKRVSTTIKVDNSNNTGINKNSKISYIFSSSEDLPTKGWNNLTFKISGNEITSTALTPENTTAKYYLYINTKNLTDSKGAKADIEIEQAADGKCISLDKNITRCGVYIADNDSPDFKGSKIIAGDATNDLFNTKYEFKAIDVGFTPKDELRMCLDINNKDNCINSDNNTPNIDKYKYYKDINDKRGYVNLNEFLNEYKNSTEQLKNANFHIMDRAMNDAKSDNYKIYHVTYNVNSGSTCAVNTKYVFQTLTYGNSVCDTSKLGYTLENWNTKDDGTGNAVDSNIEAGKYTDNNQKITLYAKWKPNKFTVKFNGNSATSGSMSSIKCTYDQNCNLPTNGFSKTGYTFVGWAKTATGNAEYSNLANVKNIIPEGEITLYAKWKPNEFTVKFNGNSATSGSMSSIKCTYDQNCNLPNNAYSRTGYEYLGWAKTATGNVAYNNLANVKNIITEGEITLYAKWKALNYEVRFNANGGSGTTDSVTCTYNTPCTLTSANFINNGYSFEGWAKTSNGNKVYDNEQSVTNIADPGGTITLYAVWIDNQGPRVTTQIKTGDDRIEFTHGSIYCIHTGTPENNYGVGDCTAASSAIKGQNQWVSIYVEATDPSGVKDNQYILNYNRTGLSENASNVSEKWLDKDNEPLYSTHSFGEYRKIESTGYRYLWINTEDNLGNKTIVLIKVNVVDMQYEITYEPNGGKPTSYPKTYKPETSAVRISNTAPYKDNCSYNCNFANWLGSDGNYYNPGDEYSTNADLKLTAQWTNTPNIRLASNIKYLCPSDGVSQVNRSDRYSNCRNDQLYNRIVITDTNYNNSTGVLSFNARFTVNNDTPSACRGCWAQLCIAKVDSKTCAYNISNTNQGCEGGIYYYSSGWISAGQSKYYCNNSTVKLPANIPVGNYKIMALPSNNFNYNDNSSYNKFSFSKFDYNNELFFTVY